MTKSGIDQNALIDMIAQATAKQGDALRKAVADATLKALQGRELTLGNIRGVLKSVTQAAAKGTARSGLPAVDLEQMLGQTIAGMDSALLKAVEANRRALQQFVDQGVALRETKLKGALADLRKMEDTFVATLTKTMQSIPEPMRAPWNAALATLQAKGSDSGLRAASTVEDFMTQAQTAVRESQALGSRAAQTLIDGYAALVSGVLIGMSEGLQQSGVVPAPSEAPRAKAAGKTARGG